MTARPPKHRGRPPWADWLLRGGLASLVLGVALPALALDPARSISQYNCRHWTRQNGLPADKINDVAQSADGYVWLASENGLIRFDGVEFTNLSIDLPTARGRNVRKLSATTSGGIRFAIQDGGFGGYDGKGFVTVGGPQWAHPDLQASTIFEARDGTVWTGMNPGISHWVPGNPETPLFGTDLTGQVMSMCEDATGQIWVGTAEHGLLYWAAGNLQTFPAPELEKVNISALAVGANGEVWVGTELGLRCYAHGKPRNIPRFNGDIKALLVDHHGALWVGTGGQGLACYKNGQFTWLRQADGLGSDYLLGLAEDAEGSLWIGTRDGLTQLSDTKFPIVSKHEGIGDGSSHMVAASPNGGLWIGTDLGLSYLDDQITTNYTWGPRSANSYIKLIFATRKGELYTEDGEKNIKVFGSGDEPGRPVSEVWTSAITEDATSLVLAVGDALVRLTNGKPTSYQYPPGPQPEFYWINNLYTARDGAVWVASKNGVFRLDQGTVRHWSASNGLSGDNVQWICEDIDGSIWVGLASGIARIKEGELKNITPADGLADNWIYTIIPDDYGSFWFNSGRGIFRASRQNLNAVADGKTARVQCELFDGLESVKATGRTDQENSGCKTRDGRIWFPCPWGVVMIDPAHIPTNDVPPPVHISRIVVNGQEYSPAAAVEVPPGKGEMEIDFTALTFVAPNNAQFKCQLVGWDNDWQSTGHRRTVLYTNLKPGHYSFRVIAANADGVWNQSGTTLAIQLRPFFYQTAWFDWLCAGLTFAVVAAIYQWRVRRTELKQRAAHQARAELEAEVTKRTAELARANESLQREIAERERMQNEIEQAHARLLENSRLAGMAEVATNVLHNVGNVLNSVNVSAALVKDKTRKSKVAYVGKVAGLLAERSTDLGEFMTMDPQGRQLPGFINDLAGQLAKEQQNTLQELASLQQHIDHIKDIVSRQQSYAKISGVAEVIPARKLVEDALLMNAGSMPRHGIELIREYAEVPPVNVEKHKVLQILVNLIRNAKYACTESRRSDKQIRLQIAGSAAGVSITIMDNGVGIAPEHLNRLFHHGFTTRQGGHGFGLHSSALAARELGGTLTFQSAGPGLGAAFTLTLPPSASPNKS